MQKAVPAIPMARIISVLNSRGVLDETLMESLQEEAIPMRRNGIQIVLGIEGGLPTGYSLRENDNPDHLEIIVADYDTQGADDDELVSFESDGFTSECLIHDLSGDHSEGGAKFVETVLDAYQRKIDGDEDDDSESDDSNADINE